jgi:hypothetical protein
MDDSGERTANIMFPSRNLNANRRENAYVPAGANMPQNTALPPDARPAEPVYSINMIRANRIDKTDGRRP